MNCGLKSIALVIIIIIRMFTTINSVDLPKARARWEEHRPP